MTKNRSSNTSQLMSIEDTVTLKVPHNSAKNNTKRKGVFLLDKPIAPSWKQPEPVSMRFGRRLAELRTGRGRTQSWLAEESGLDRSFISDMERGVKEPTISTQDAIARSFNMTISELMKGV